MKDVLDFFFLSKAPKWKKRRKKIGNKSYALFSYYNLLSNLAHEVVVRFKTFWY